MTSDETLDLLQEATLKLIQGGSLKERLVDAYSCHLVQLNVEQVPDGLRGEFTAMRHAMQREQPLPRESMVRASVRKMSGEDALRHAGLVVRLFAEMARANVAAEGITATARRKIRPAPHAPLFKLFAAEG